MSLLKNHLCVLGSIYDHPLYLPMLEIFGVGNKVLNILHNTKNTTPLKVKVLLSVIPWGVLDICSYILDVYTVESFILLTQIWPSYFKVFNPFIQQETFIHYDKKTTKVTE